MVLHPWPPGPSYVESLRSYATSTTIAAVYENGIFRPDQPVSLRDKTRVRLIIETPPQETVAEDPAGWKAIDEVIGFIEEAPHEAVGRDHDRYLYRW